MKVPSVLVASDRAKELQEYGEDADGWYYDGAYTGAPNERHQFHGRAEDEDYDDFVGAGESEDEDTQDAYYVALLARFSAFRDALRKPPPENIDRQSSRLSAAANPFSKHVQWSYALRMTAPTAKSISDVPQEQIINMLTRLDSVLIQRNLLAPGGEGKFIGAWAWTLLAKCRTVGEMNSEEISVLRTLAKTAIKVAKKISASGADESRFEGHDATVDMEMDPHFTGTVSLPGASGSRVEHDGGDEGLPPISSSQEQSSISSNAGNIIIEEHAEGREIKSTLDTIRLPDCTPAAGVGDIGTDASQFTSIHTNNEAVSDTPQNPSDPMSDGTELEDGEILPDEPSYETSYQPPEGDDPIQIELAKRKTLLDMFRANSSPDARSGSGPEGSAIKADDGVEEPDEPTPIADSSHSSGDNKSISLKKRALATLDIIVTIVGEAFGQRDLLAAREVWE